jgi:sulfatase modifying factor 1
MPLMNVSLWDNYKHAIEALSGGRNTVMFDDLKLPSVMVRVPAFDVADIDADLGAGVHPAYLVNAVQKAEIMVGMYKAYVYGSRAYSLPYKDPAASINFDNSLNACLMKNQGDTTRRVGFHMFTNWEAAAVALQCIKNGQPSGNTDYGRHHTNKQQVGIRQDGLLPGTASGTARTLNGSGPASWRHDGTFAGIDGLCGNVYEWVDGMKLVNGKFFFPDDNNYTQLEASWKDQGVIIAEDTGDKLGVDGTNTLHAGGGVNFGAWKGLTRTSAYAALSDAIKNRFQQAMIDPAFDSSNPIGSFYFNTTGEMIPVRFGVWNIGAGAGVALLSLNGVRTGVGASIGFRLAYIG